jgi:hypothetical protein
MLRRFLLVGWLGVVGDVCCRWHVRGWEAWRPNFVGVGVGNEVIGPAMESSDM